jgi:hypothetical protein
VASGRNKAGKDGLQSSFPPTAEAQGPAAPDKARSTQWRYQLIQYRGKVTSLLGTAVHGVPLVGERVRCPCVSSSSARCVVAGTHDAPTCTTLGVCEWVHL